MLKILKLSNGNIYNLSQFTHISTIREVHINGYRGDIKRHQFTVYFSNNTKVDFFKDNNISILEETRCKIELFLANKKVLLEID